MNLADQIEASADRAVADLLALRVAHSRRVRGVADAVHDETSLPDGDGSAT